MNTQKESGHFPLIQNTEDIWWKDLVCWTFTEYNGKTSNLFFLSGEFNTPHLLKVEDGMSTFVCRGHTNYSLSPAYFHLGTIYKWCSLGDRLLQKLFAFLPLTSFQLSFSLTFYNVFLPPTFKQSPVTSLGSYRKKGVTKIMENPSTEAKTSRKRRKPEAGIYHSLFR